MSQSRLRTLGETESSLARFVRTIVMIPIMLILGVVLLMLLPFLAIWRAFRTVRGVRLDRAYRRKFASIGKPAILVYSESPNWQAHFEEHILSDVGDRAVVLNWSERRRWAGEMTLPIRVYQHHRPEREFNPYALVYGPKGPPTHISFFAAFRDDRHGKPASLNQAIADLSEAMEEASSGWAEVMRESDGAA